MSYAATQERAAAMIADKGQTVTLTRHTESAYDPATGDVATTDTTTVTSGVVLPLARGFVHSTNTNIEAGDRQLLLSADIDEPEVGDSVTIGGIAYTLSEVSPLAPGGTALVYDCIIRGAP